VAKSRRKAREAALRALYELEFGKRPLHTILKDTIEAASLDPELTNYAERLITGVREHQASIDDNLAKLILEYDFDRIAAIDRNVMRIAAFELYYEPPVPPAVTINEAIEIAKKYSTAESGKFVNGVLGRLLKESPKADWDPATAPKEEREEVVHEPPVAIEEERIEAGSDEEKRLSKMGGWKLRSEDST
jgi:N utilization substance protein B